MEQNHLHHHHHNHEDFDPGELYKAEWVQELILIIQNWLQQNAQWAGMDQSKKQRILDYACGNGTISRAFVTTFQSTVFQGIDSHSNQVDRFNDEARKLLSDSHDRMYAIQGDLINPSPALDDPKWFDFDIVIISMALHHVEDPLDMLLRLKKRLKPGGTLFVAEFVPESELRKTTTEQTLARDGPPDESTDPSPAKTNDKSDRSKMIEVVGGQRIWDGFNIETMESIMTAAGCTGVEVKMHPETFTVPGTAGHAGEKRMIFAKGIAA